MALHPIALHFHVAVFILNIIAVLALSIVRLATSPQIIEEDVKTRWQGALQALDYIVVVTIIIGLITTAIAMLSGAMDLWGLFGTPPPHIADFKFDIFMQMKILMSIVFIFIYLLPLFLRFKYKKLVWKSKGMSFVYLLLLFAGFFFVITATFLGNYSTAYMIHGAGQIPRVTQTALEWLSVTGIFVIFGADFASLNITDLGTYTPGVEVPFDFLALSMTMALIAAIVIATLLIFRGLKLSIIRSYNEELVQFKQMLEKNKINSGNVDLQRCLAEMMELDIKQTG